MALEPESLEAIGKHIAGLRQYASVIDVKDSETRGRIQRLLNELDDMFFHRVATITQRILMRKSNRFNIRFESISGIEVKHERDTVETIARLADDERELDILRYLRAYFGWPEKTKTLLDLAHTISERGAYSDDNGKPEIKRARTDSVSAKRT